VVARRTASDRLILANASGQPVTGSIVISDIAGRTFQQTLAFGAGQTQRLDLREITQAAHFAGGSGGVTVRATSAAGNLIASHIVFDESAGMSAIMKTFTRDTADKPETRTMRAPMMALTTPDPVLQFPNGTTLLPQVFVRNASAAPMNVAASVDWRTASQRGTLPLGPLSLAPGEVRILNVRELTGAGQVPSDAYWATVVLKYEGRSGDLIPVAASLDASGRFGLQTPFSEGVSHLWKGSMWHVDAKRNSIITTGNGGTEPTRAAVTLFYNKGKGSYTIEKRLEPGEQIWADVGEIIRAQIPDKSGNTMPPDVMMGSYELRDLDHPGRGYLYEGKLIIDKTWGHGYYGCAGCCGASRAQLNPDPLGGPITTGAWNAAQAYETCEDLWVDYTDQATGWASANTGVVTLSDAYSNFVGIGGTTGSADLELEGNIERNGVCLMKYLEPHSTQNTVPGISWAGGPVITTPQNVVVGQEIFLTGNPTGGTWSGILQAVSGFSVGPENSTGSPDTLIQESETTNVLFYWTPNPGDLNPFPAAVKYTVSGSSATATFTIYPPTKEDPYAMIATTNGRSISFVNDGTNVGAACGNAASTNCMALTETVGPANGVSGSTQWVQVIDSFTKNFTALDGSQHSCGIPAIPALDNYLAVSNAIYTDSPRFVYPEANITQLIGQAEFSTVLEWQPALANSIFVPIASTNWGYGATDTLTNGVWALTDVTYPSASVLFGAYWPVWYSLYTNGEALPCD